MNIPVTLIISLAAALVGNIIKKYYADKTANSLLDSFVFNAIGCMTATLILFTWDGFAKPSLYTVILGVIFGAVTALQGISNIAALGCGPMSYTSVIISFSTLIAAFSGIMFFGESIQITQIVGILFMLISFVLAAEKRSSERKSNLKWFILCLIAFTATGIVGIIQKFHQNSAHKSELSELLIISFITSAVICAFFIPVLKNADQRNPEPCEFTSSKHREKMIFIVIIFVSGVCVAVNNKFNLYLSGVMESAVFFPVVNGGGLVLSTLAAVFIFREKLTKKQWLGVVLGIVSVVLLCNPF